MVWLIVAVWHWLTVDHAFTGFFDLKVDDVLTHVMNRALNVAPRAEDVTDAADTFCG